MDILIALAISACEIFFSSSNSVCLPSQMTHYIKFFIPVSPKCKKEFGNCGKIEPGTMLLSMPRWPGWGETASVPPREFTKADTGSDILHYSRLHSQNLWDLTYCWCTSWALSVWETGVCAFLVMSAGEKDIIWEKQSVIFCSTKLPPTDLVIGLCYPTTFWATTSRNPYM